MRPTVTPEDMGGPLGNDLLNSSISGTVNGDSMWGIPRPIQNDDTFRIAFWNCNGFPAQHTDAKNKMIHELITVNAFNVFGFSEVNVHWPNVTSSHHLSERTRTWFETIHISKAYLQPWLPNTTYQVGGTMLWSLNQAAHRVIATGCDDRNLGRWTWTKYRGANGRHIRIIAAYRCVYSPGGVSTVYNQQLFELEKQHIITDPRQLFLTDLYATLQKWLNEGDQIVLGLDLNESIISAEFTSRLSSFGFVEINIHNYGPNTPPTYFRGSTTIDGIYVSSTLQQSTSGYFPFIGDHRLLWIDIPSILLFDGDTIPTRVRARRLKLTDPRVYGKYQHELQLFMEHHNLANRVEALLQHQHVWPVHILCQEYNNLDKLRVQGMHEAERKCRKLHMGNVPYTPTYSKLAQTVLFWGLIIKIKNGKRVDTRFLSRQMKKNDITWETIQSTTLDEAVLFRRLAYSKLRDYSKEAATARTTWLEEVAAARATVSGLNEETEYKALLLREQQRKNARQITATIKTTNKRGLSMVQVQREGSLINVATREDMEQILMIELSNRFHQARNTPFLSSPLLHLVGRLGTEQGAQDILNGTFRIPDELDTWTKKLIPHLRYIDDITAAQHEFTCFIDTPQHQAGWKRMKETTSPGFSKLSFAQFKAGAMVPEIARMDAIFATVPFSTGMSPSRWQQGVDVLLQKQEGNFSPSKLRAILLFEPDFNQNNKLLGKQTMHIAEKFNAVAPEQFGSRKSMAAIDQSLNKTLTFDLWRQLRIPGALCSNDAKSCYDRIVHNFASLALQRVGIPVPPIVSMFSTIQNLKHHIRTVYGESTTSFSGEEWTIPIHGVGQGNGCGPQVWALVSTPILNMLRSEKCGSFFQSAITQTPLHFVGYSFVDDTDLVTSRMEYTTAQSTVTHIQQALEAWEGGLYTTGGALVPEKCHWYLVDFIWKNGVPQYTHKRDQHYRLKVKNAEGVSQEVKQLNYDEAERTLGVRIAPNGNMDIQTQYMYQQVLLWSDKIRSGTLSRHLVQQALHTTISKTLLYPLPATTLSEHQCKHILSPIRSNVLPKIGVARTFPTELLYANHEHLGLGLPNLFWQQGISHIDRLIRYNKSQHLTGHLLRHSLEAFRLEIGCNGSIFTLPYQQLHWITTDSWVKHTWQFIQYANIEVHIQVPELILYRDNDQLLIPLFINLGFKKKALAQLNRCRIYLQVTTLSDIVTADGNYLTSYATTGQINPSTTTPYHWPNQGPLPLDHWITWRHALAAICQPGTNTLIHPLALWQTTSHFRFHHDPITELLYEQDGQDIGVYQRTHNRHSRNPSYLVHSKHNRNTLPSQCTPVSVEIKPQIIRITGYATKGTTINPAPPTSLIDMLASQCPEPMHWVFTNIDFTPEFWNLITSSTCDLYAVSDGSYKTQHGTASWIIRPSTNPHIWFKGSVITPGSSTMQSAYRSELAGLYAIIATFWMWSKQNFMHRTVTIGCDGASALNMSQIPDDFISPNIAHFDLIYAIRTMLRNIPSIIHWKHIRGHQDAVPEAELDEWALLNIQMDLHAKAHWERTAHIDEQARQIRVYGEPAAVLLGGHKVTINLPGQILHHLSQGTALPFWRKKYNFDSSLVNWNAVKGAMKRSKPTTRVWASKQAVRIFGYGKMMHRWKYWDSPTCVRCQLADETPEHIIKCTEAHNQQTWVTKLQTLQQWMEKNNSSPLLTQVIILNLKSWYTDTTLEFPTMTPASIQQAQLAQNAIGWYPMLQGFLSIHWQSIQAAYLLSIHSRASPKKWTEAFILQLWSISWDFWELRNGFVHNVDEGRLVQSLNIDIHQCFLKGTHGLSPNIKRLFSSGEEQVLRYTTTNKQLWVQRVQFAQRHRHGNQVSAYQGERTTMLRWLQTRNN